MVGLLNKNLVDVLISTVIAQHFNDYWNDNTKAIAHFRFLRSNGLRTDTNKIMRYL